MKKIKRWWIERKIRDRQIRKLEIMRQLEITEHNGKIWLMCNGIAVQEINPLASAKEIVTILATARKAAVEYESHK